MKTATAKLAFFILLLCIVSIVQAKNEPVSWVKWKGKESTMISDMKKLSDADLQQIIYYSGLAYEEHRQAYNKTPSESNISNNFDRAFHGQMLEYSQLVNKNAKAVLNSRPSKPQPEKSALAETNRSYNADQQPSFAERQAAREAQRQAARDQYEAEHADYLERNADYISSQIDRAYELAEKHDIEKYRQRALEGTTLARTETVSRSTDIDLAALFDEMAEVVQETPEKPILETLQEETKLKLNFLADYPWTSPMEIEAVIKSNFNEYFNCDIDKIIKKAVETHHLSADEYALYQDFLSFKDNTCTSLSEICQERMDEADMKDSHYALMAKGVYHVKEDEALLGKEGISRITVPTQINELLADSIQKSKASALLDGIVLLNNQGSSSNKSEIGTGFGVDMYYDEKLGEFVVSFRGSDVGDQNGLAKDIIGDWLNANLQQAVGKPSAQHGSAYALTRLLKEASESGLKITLVGHSLGGGLASLAGISTGLKTYTYNAAGIHDNTLQSFGLLEKKAEANNNITAFYSDDDILNKLQDELNRKTREERKELANTVKKVGTAAEVIAVSTTSAMPTVVVPVVASVMAKAALANPDDTKFIIDKATDKLLADGLIETLKEKQEIKALIEKAIVEAPPALGQRVNIGAAGAHQMGQMVEAFNKPDRSYHSERWQQFNNSLFLLQETKKNTTSTFISIDQASPQN